MAGPELHQRTGYTVIQQRLVQIRPVDHGIGITHMAAEILAQRHLGDLLGGLRVHQAERVDIDRLRPRLIADA